MAVAPRARASQRGAAVFVVVMVVTLLTAIGIFAVRSASLVNVASGHARQGMQTRLLAEYATRIGVMHLGAVGTAAQNVGAMGATREDGKEETCLSENKVRVDLFGRQECKVVRHEDLAVDVNAASPGQLLLDPQTAALDGSLGPRLVEADANPATALEGVFRVEAVEYHSAGMLAGSNSGSDPDFTTITITTYAHTASGGGACPSPEAAPSMSVRAMRASFTVLTQGRGK